MHVSNPNRSRRGWRLTLNVNLHPGVEYRTSCITNKTKEFNKNLYLPDKKGKKRLMHSILTYKMGNGRLGCINRDYNGALNIREVSLSILKYNEKPEIFRRENKKSL